MRVAIQLQVPAALLHARVMFGPQPFRDLGAFQVLSRDPQRFHNEFLIDMSSFTWSTSTSD